MSYTNDSRGSGSWDSPSVPVASSYSNESVPTNKYDSGLEFLLQQIGDYLLNENGSKIVLNQSPSVKADISYTNDTLNSDSYTNDTK